MILMIGGAYQGKLGYALEYTGADEERAVCGRDCKEQELYTAAVIDQFHELIRRWMEAEKQPEELVKKILASNPEVVIIADEIGSGIVPADPGERAYREKTGRICCMLARKAKQVHRIVCGIGTVIKDA